MIHQLFHSVNQSAVSCLAGKFRVSFPYGFLLIDNNVVYFYQQPLPAEGD
jgi:hypothetical protein